MKKYIGFIILASFVFSFSLVLAQENSNTSNTTPTLNATLRNTLRAEISTTREAFKAQMLSERESYVADLKAKREAFAAEVKAKKEEFRQTNNESKNEFRDRASAIMEKRFQAAFINLERAQTKIEELITKINAEGKDTTSATESLNSSKDNLTNAKNKSWSKRS
ncbi:hypothetical protein K8Q98_00830 [Candidatus Nomurabacteria bacterium]|nr:hypothetical protein [Candidatus Nomurabacteria bacterium]